VPGAGALTGGAAGRVERTLPCPGVVIGAGGPGGPDGVEQAASKLARPTIMASKAFFCFSSVNKTIMWLIVLEALAALGVLVFLVWWTMFAGRRDLHDDDSSGP